MTTIIVCPSEVAWAASTAKLLRDRGMKVVRLRDLWLVGFLLLSDRIAAVFIDAPAIASGKSAALQRMRNIAPDCRIVVVEDRDRSPEDLVAVVLA